VHRIHAEIVGTGPTVVLTHGWGATSATWEHQVAALRETHRVVTWDLLGHGRSDAPDDPTAYTRDVALAQLDELIGDDGPATLIGHSLGGQLSLAFAARHPDRVTALGLVATGPGYRDADGMATWNRGVEKLATRREEQGQLGHAHAIRGFVAQHDSLLMDSAPTIMCPTVVVVGREDTQFLAAADWFER
jgi:pimeloyl-ACP methyl ester carboxylesterase